MGFGSGRLKSASPAQQVQGKRLLGALVEVESAPAGACPVGPAASAPPTECVRIGVVVAVVSRRHFVAVKGVVSGGN